MINKKLMQSLALLLTMGLTLSACGQNSTEDVQSETKETSVSSEATSSEKEEETASSEEKADIPESWLCEEKTTLTISTFDAIVSSLAVPSNDLRFWQWLEEYTNVHIEWELTPYASYNEVLNARLSAGEVSGDIMVTGSPQTAEQAGTNGLFVDMEPYWDTCFPYLKAEMEGMGYDVPGLLSSLEGEMYAITGFVQPRLGHVVILYNTQWMEKLGAEVPKTLDEFNALIRQMKEAGDLNGNGEDDEVVLTSSMVALMDSAFNHVFDIDYYLWSGDFYADENGVVKDNYTSDNMKAYLTWLNGLYEEGILDPEYINMAEGNLTEKIASDRVGIFPHYAHFAMTYGNLTTAGLENPGEEYFTIGYPLESEYNGYEPYYIDRALLDTGTCVSVTTACENPELAMKWLDVFMSDPVVVKTRDMGWEGEHWEYNEKGEMVVIEMPDNLALGTGQPPISTVQSTYAFDLVYDLYPWMDSQYDERVLSTNFRQTTIPTTVFRTEEEQALISQYGGDVGSYWNEMKQRFIIGDEDINTSWDDFAAEMEIMGLDELTKAYQSAYDRLK